MFELALGDLQIIGEDGRNAELRAPIIGKLVERFGGWQEDAA